MRTRNELLSKFAELVEQDAKELDPEFEKTLVPGYGKRKEDEYWGTPEYHAGIKGRKDEEPDVSKGYGISKRNAKILAEEDPESYVHKHKYHLVGKLQKITEEMFDKILAEDPKKFFDYKFHHVPQLQGIAETAFRLFARRDLEGAIKSHLFAKPELSHFALPLLKLAARKYNWQPNDFKFLSTKLRAIPDAELRSGLEALVNSIRRYQSDDFFSDPDISLLKHDSKFSNLFIKEDEAAKKHSMRLDLLSITKLGEILREAVDIPVPPVPSNLTVAPPSKPKPSTGPSVNIPIPMELPEVEPEPSEAEERAFQERQKRNELEHKLYMAKPIPAKIVPFLEQLPDASIYGNRAEGSWTKGDKNYQWSFEVNEGRPGIDKASYTIELVEFPVTLMGKSSRTKPKVLFEQTGPHSVELYKTLRGAIAELLSKQRYISDEQKERHQEREEKRQEEKDKSEVENERNQRQKEFNKWLEEEEGEEEEKSLSFLRAKDLITKVSIRLKTKGFVDEANKLEEVIQNLKHK